LNEEFEKLKGNFAEKTLEERNLLASDIVALKVNMVIIIIEITCQMFVLLYKKTQPIIS